MLGAIAGDIIGSVYESGWMKSTDFPLFSPQSTFTDDTVLTVAVADCILYNKYYAATLKEYGQRYPNAGYSGMFYQWLYRPGSAPYKSYGNGSAMRVSPIGFAFDTIEVVLTEAKRSAEVTHNHPEGIRGAQAIASAIFLARMGKGKREIAGYIEGQFDYNLSQTLDEIRPGYHFDETCQGSVPQAIIAFLESTDYEGAVRKAISLGGDSDTLACMAGGIAQAYYGRIADCIVKEVRQILNEQLLSIVDEFNSRYGI
jgi:ADP-ribosylglycohydrolase